MVLILTALSSCLDDNKERASFSFNASVEQLQDERKVRLVDEKWIYWEEGDAISIASDKSASGPMDTAYLSRPSGSAFAPSYNGVFVAPRLDATSRYFLALHPKSSYHRITISGTSPKCFSNVQMHLPSEQSYRNDTTFSRRLFPMVAWYGGDWQPGQDTSTAYNLNFHNLAGLVRLQFYNNTGSTHTIKSISIRSKNNAKQICGMFSVNNRYTNNPSLSPLGVAASGSGEDIHLITITPHGGVAFEQDRLLSFYLVMPAIHGMDSSENYTLTVTVTNTNNQSFSRDLTVPVRRNAITYCRAVEVTSFANHTTAIGLVGNGTAARPFKIYTAAELRLVRDSFAHPRADGYVYINGQRITESSCFKIMRSDITLSRNQWTRGIPRFRGIMSYSANIPGGGITIHSDKPLFESISDKGRIENITVICDTIVNNNTTRNYSPLCDTNYGWIVNCNFTTPPSDYESQWIRYYGNGNNSIAGICLFNNGIIQGCSSTGIAHLYNNSNFAGICYTNRSQGIIRECMISGPTKVVGAIKAGGVCLYNYGTIRNCYYDAQYTSGSTEWGAIAYYNGDEDHLSSTNTIVHCYMSESAIIHSDIVGGIVCNNYGTVNYCWTNGQLRGTVVGGIATYVRGGTLVNCFVDNDLWVLALKSSAQYGGAMAAVLSNGTIKNCYARIYRISHLDETSTYGTVVGNITGGTVNNCYAYETAYDATPTVQSLFYGANTSGSLTHCYLVRSTQSGVTTFANTSQGLSDLKDALNTNRPSGTPSSYTWINGPKLSPYSF